MKQFAGHDTEIMEQIAERLDDEENWVRLNAVLALTSFGDKAQQNMVLGQIEANLETDDAQLKERTENALKKIRAAKPDPDAEQAFSKTLESIREYCDRRK